MAWVSVKTKFDDYVTINTRNISSVYSSVKDIEDNDACVIEMCGRLDTNDVIIADCSRENLIGWILAAESAERREGGGHYEVGQY